MPSVISSVQTLKLSSSVWAKGGGDGHVAGIAPPRDQHASDPRHVVAGIESVPPAADKDFEPCGKIPNGLGRRRPHIAQVSGAIARGNIHAAAERDGQVGVVAADPDALVEHLPVPSWWGAHSDNRKRYGCEQNRRSSVRGAHPGGDWLKRSQAAWDSRSVSQYRLPSRKTRVSSGRSSTACCCALGK